MTPLNDGVRIDDRILPAQGFTASELSDAMYHLTADPDQAALLVESCDLDEADAVLNPGVDLIAEAVTAVKNRLDRTMSAMVRVFNRYADKVKPYDFPSIGPDRKNALFAYKTTTFTFDDGQTVSILFHSPGRDPMRLKADDTLIAYRWMLNRRDITATVAPEKGRDLNLQTMARRIMQLVEENSEKFQANNEKRQEQQEKLATLESEQQEVAQRVDALTQENATLAGEVETAEQRIERLRARLAEVGEGSREGNAAGGLASTGALSDDLNAVTGDDEGLKRTVEGIKDVQARLDAAGVNYPSPTTLMQQINAGEKPGYSIAMLQKQVKDNLESLAALQAGRLRGDKIVGRGNGGKPAAIQYLNMRIKQDNHAIETGGMGNYVNLSNYRHTLNQLLRESEAAQEGSGEQATQESDNLPDRPTTPEDFARIIAAGDDAKRQYQDALDSFFQSRVIDVRNALREMGWEGQRYGKLHANRNGKRYTMDIDTEQAGAGANVVGVTYAVVANQADDAGVSTGPASFVGSIQDDLARTPVGVAKAIDAYALPAESENDEAETLEQGVRRVFMNNAGAVYQERDAQELRRQVQDELVNQLGIERSAAATIYSIAEGNRYRRMADAGRYEQSHVEPQDIMAAVQSSSLAQGSGEGSGEGAAPTDESGDADNQESGTAEPDNLEALDTGLYRDISRSISVIRGIDDGTEQGYNRSLFTSSIANKLKTQARNGNEDVVDAALLLIAQQSIEHGKPILAKRNAIWKATGRDMDYYTEIAKRQGASEEGGDAGADKGEAPAPTPEGGEGAEGSDNTPSEVERIGAALQGILQETDSQAAIDAIEQLMDEAEAAGIDIDNDPDMLAASDHITKLLEQEAA